ncbi:DUF6470 family protein [Paenibacillus glucanolyticus]
MIIPQIQIRQGYAKIGLETTKGQQSIEQPKASLNITQEQGQMEIQRSYGSLEIDSRRAWSALVRGKIEEVMDRVAQEAFRISMENIEKIVKNGDRMMAIHKGGNVFADIARQIASEERPIQIAGEPGYDNVDITYLPSELKINFIPKGVTFNPEQHHPVINYNPGKLEVYLRSKNFISISIMGTQINTVV